MEIGEKLVSVIIPTYNRSVACREAVLSVLNQSYANTEIIVIDDGSNDNTSQLIDGMNNKVKYIWQENAGVSAARNTGIRLAKGDYVAFLDSDDVWLPWKLSLQLKAFEMFPQAGMIWTDMTAVDADNNILFETYLRRMYKSYEYLDIDKVFDDSLEIRQIWEECPTLWKKKKFYVGNIFSQMFMGNLVHTSTVLVKRDRLIKVGNFDLQLLKSGEDYDFHFRTCRLGDVAFIDIPTIRYRIGAQDQLTNQEYMVWIAKNDLKTISKMLKEAKDELKLPKYLIRKRMAYCYAWNGTEEMNHNSFNARKYFVKSLMYKPNQLKIIIMIILTLFPNRILNIVRGIKKMIHFAFD